MHIDIDKDANMGSGNIIQKFNINTVQQLITNVQTVNNHGTFGKDEIKDEAKAGKPARKNPMEQRELAPIREQIMFYVSCLNTEEIVTPEWLNKYMDLWDQILDLPEVATEVYSPGKQQKTSFNRNLVANIIYYLGNQSRKERQVYKNYNASFFAEKLEKDKDHPVRAALGKYPPEEIKKSIDRLLNR